MSRTPRNAKKTTSCNSATCCKKSANDILKIYKPGTVAYIGSQSKRDIEVEITAVTIRDYSVLYEVTWWADNSQKQLWLPESRISFGKSAKVSVGFNSLC